jgi:hypothetical protein
MPVPTLEQLKQYSVAGRIGAISIDTSVYEQYQFGFESGVLAQLEQFARLDIEHLLLDTVVDEIRSHLKSQAELHRAHLKNALKPLGNSWGIGKEQRDAVMLQLFGEDDIDLHIQQRLKKFLASTNATLLECAEYADLATLVDLFLEAKPPFSKNSAKKFEFPDALTLISLENWAAKIETKVVVVSKDNDWKKYCEHSKALYHVDELANALSIFQGGAENAIQLFLEALKNDSIEDIDSQIEYGISSQADKIDADCEASSNWYFEPELIDISAEITASVKEQLRDYEVVDYENNQLTLQANIEIDLYTQFIVNFKHWDGIDKEYLPMGSATLESTDPTTVSVILTILFENGVVSIDLVELLSHRVTKYFGEIEPDWMDREQYEE